MSCSSASSSGVLKRSTSRARSSRRGSPKRNTDLTATIFHQLLEYATDALERDLQGRVDILHAHSVAAQSAPSGVVGDHCDSRIAQVELTGERGLRHSCHSYHGGSVALESVDL